MQTCFFPADGRTCFYQWDIDREMIVTDAAIKELHYCNGTSDCSLVCAVVDGKACVPNILLQTAGNISVYGYTGDHTEIKKVYQVMPRTKPEDYVYTETEVKRYDSLEQGLANVKERVYQDGLPYSEFETEIALDNFSGPVDQNGSTVIDVPLNVDYDTHMLSADWPLAIGTKCVVVWDGVEYATVCQFGNRGMFVGNANMCGGADTGEPFAILLYCLAQANGTGQTGLAMSQETTTERTISIIAKKEKAVNVMDKKYMPDDMTELYLTASNGVKYCVTVTTSGTLAVTKVT